jgi:hypothetical protein
MADTPRSKRFKPNLVTEKIVPVVLVILLVVLLAVFIVIGLSLAGIFPAG